MASSIELLEHAGAISLSTEETKPNLKIDKIIFNHNRHAAEVVHEERWPAN